MSKKIYLVDDDPDMVKVMTFRLKSQGYEVIPFTSGKDLIDALSGEPPDLFMLDFQMPDMNGREVAEAIEKNPATQNHPIIYLTGKVDFDDALVQGKGNRAVFIKPCNFDELGTKIREMTGG